MRKSGKALNLYNRVLEQTNDDQIRLHAELGLARIQTQPFRVTSAKAAAELWQNLAQKCDNLYLKTLCEVQNKCRLLCS